MLPNNLIHYNSVTPFVSGSTQSAFKLEANGLKPLVIKSGAHPDHIKIEILCTKILEVLGVNVPKVEPHSDLPTHILSQMKVDPQDVFKVSEFITAHSKYFTQDLRGVACQTIITTAQQSFMANVLIGNIDVTALDNWIYAENGKAYLIDIGSNIIYRARGELRHDPEDALTELFSMRDVSINTAGYHWFKDISEEVIREQVSAILDKTRLIESVVWRVAEKLNLPDKIFLTFINGLIRRLDILAEGYCPEKRKISILDQIAVAKQSRAYIIPYTHHDGVPSLFLSKSSTQNEYRAIGAISEYADELLLDTAIRCVNTQFVPAVFITKATLLKSTCHDYLDINNNVHRYYFVKCDFYHIEQENMYWVPISKVLNTLEMTLSAKNNEVKSQKNGLEKQVNALDFEYNDTLLRDNERKYLGNNITCPDATIALHDDLLLMMGCESVVKLFTQIVIGHRVNLTRTQDCAQKSTPSLAAISASVSDRAKIAAFRMTPKPMAITSPRVVKWQLADSLLKHSAMIIDFKHKISASNTLSNVVSSESLQSGMVLSQSEIHMQAWLGAKFRPDDIEYNLLQMLKIQPEIVKAGVSCGDQYVDNKKLIPYLHDLIKNEKKDSSVLYLYHGCSAQIAFVYMIYSLLYEQINIDPSLVVFRANKEVFCENIQAFIMRYSTHLASDGKYYINDHDAGYNDQMISANLFLFGAQQDLFEGSLQFFTNDYAVRTIDINRLLASCLIPLGMSAAQIDYLVSLYPVFQRCHGSALYQIAIAPDDVANHVYPAKKLGPIYHPRHNGNLNDKDLLSIFQRYRAECLSNNLSADAIQFIKTAQARLFAYPDLKLTCQLVTYADVMLDAKQAKQELLKLKTAVQRTLTELLHDMLSSDYRDFPVISNHVTLFRQSQLIRNKNNLTVVEVLPPEIQLAKAILSNNEKMTLHLLMKYPQIKNSLITYEHPTYLAGCDNIKFDKLMPIQIILYYSNLPISILSSVYGEEWWNNHALFVEAKPEKIYQIVKSIDVQYRLSFLALSSIKDKVSDLNAIFNITPQLLDDTRLIFLDTHLPTDVNFNWYYHALRYLDGADKTFFIFKHAYFILNGKDLSFILKELGDLDKIKLLKLCRDKVNTPHCVDSVVSQLPSAYVSQFIHQYHHLITLPRMLCGIIKALPQNERYRFIENNAYDMLSIKDAYEILFLYVELKDSDLRQRYATYFKIDRVKDLYAILNQYIYSAKPMDFLEFALSYQHLITTETVFNEIKKKLKGDAVKVFVALHDALLGEKDVDQQPQVRKGY